MPDPPPTLDYQPPERCRQPPNSPPPKLRLRWALLCWLPPALAALAAGIIGYHYRDVAHKPRPLYSTQQTLLRLGFGWFAAAALFRIVRAFTR